MDEQLFQRDLASYQQEQVFLRHLTTLSTGCILLMATFLEKLFTHPEWKVLVGISFVSFAISIVGALAMHFLSIINISRSETHTISNLEGIIGAIFLVLSFGGFLAGIGSLTIFALKNLY